MWSPAAIWRRSLMATALSANSERHARRHRKGIQGTPRTTSDPTSICCRSARHRPALQDAALKLLALGEGKTGVFKLRQKELDANDYGQTVLEETRKLNVGLDISVQQLVEGVRKDTDAATCDGARGDLVRDHGHAGARRCSPCSDRCCSSGAMSAATSCGRIGGLQRSMQLLSNGDLDTEIYRSSQHDEIAAMADALEVFRESMIQARALSSRAGQGPRRQGRARLPHGGADRRVRGHRARPRSTICSAPPTPCRRPRRACRRPPISPTRWSSAVAAAAEETSANVQTRVRGHRATVVLDRRDRPSGGDLGADRPQGGRGSRRHRCHHAGARRQCQPHLRRGRPDPGHRLADQPAGAQRHHRGGARRRSRPRLCGGRLRGEEPRQPDREGDRRDPHADRQHAAGRRPRPSAPSATSARPSPRSTA